MSRVLFEVLARHAAQQPAAVALRGEGGALRYGELPGAIAALADACRDDTGTVGLIADNGPHWALADLAMLAAGRSLVPLPLFFSPAQAAHALRDAGVTSLLVDPALPLPEPLASLPREALPLPAGCGRLQRIRLPWASARTLPAGTAKITYTSGSTGAPKGVCLDTATQLAQARALAAAVGAGPGDVHLAALPLATLLENIGGVYAPLLAGAETRLPSLAAVGLSGASGFQPQALLAQLQAASANTLILVPQQLLALVRAIEAGASAPPSLRVVAVGGASVSPRLIDRAVALGLPVYEGYGLSECSSVVALNRPGAARPGSVGRPLPGLDVQVSDRGELVVSGRGFLGYVGEAERAADAPVATGDLGHFDADGYLHLDGRSKNLIVTAFGRNVSPEWIERELTVAAAIPQAAVFGDGQPSLSAVIVSTASDAAIDAALAAINALLPDYARVRRWLRADAPFSTANQQLTANGRPRRAAIVAAYGARLAALHEETETP